MLPDRSTHLHQFYITKIIYYLISLTNLLNYFFVSLLSSILHNNISFSTSQIKVNYLQVSLPLLSSFSSAVFYSKLGACTSEVSFHRFYYSTATIRVSINDTKIFNHEIIFASKY